MMKLFCSASFFLVLRALHASATMFFHESAPPEFKALVPGGHDDDRRLQSVEQDALWTLFDSKTDFGKLQFEDGATINLFEFGKQLNIMFFTYPNFGASCVFDFNGKKNFRTENEAPFALFGDNNPVDVETNIYASNYLPGKLPLGENTLTATVYSEKKGKGEVITSTTITFTVIDEVVPTISEIFRVRTPGGEVLEDLSCVREVCSSTYILDTEEELTSFSFLAYANGPVGSVKITHGQAFPGNGFNDLTIIDERIENKSPYTLAGDAVHVGGDINPYLFEASSTSIITFTPYTGPNGTGEAGRPFGINVIVSSCLFDPTDIYFFTPGDLCSNTPEEACEESVFPISTFCPSLCGRCD